MIRSFLALLGLAFAASGCAASLTAAGAGVKLAKGDPAPGCVEVGYVSGYAIGPGFQERLMIGMRNDAAAKGGNYVRLDSLMSNGNASGTAFRCP